MPNQNGWKRYKVVCENCGAESLKSNKSKTCGIKCRDELRVKRNFEASPVMACPACLRIARLTVTAKGERVCSISCRAAIWSKQRSERDWEAYKQERYKRPELGSICKCLKCNEEYVQKRYDAKFCSVRCSDSWNILYGNKGKNRREKLANAKMKKESEIGSCALCGVHHESIVIENDLGKTKKNGTSKFHEDHVETRSKGGSDDPGNKRWLCWFCNLARMDMDSVHDSAVAAAGAAFWKVINEGKS